MSIGRVNMREIKFVIAAVAAMFFVVATAQAEFDCETKAGQKCNCTGSDNCKELRHSGMCADNMK